MRWCRRGSNPLDHSRITKVPHYPPHRCRPRRSILRRTCYRSGSIGHRSRLKLFLENFELEKIRSKTSIIIRTYSFRTRQNRQPQYWQSVRHFYLKLKSSKVSKKCKFFSRFLKNLVKVEVANRVESAGFDLLSVVFWREMQMLAHRKKCRKLRRHLTPADGIFDHPSRKLHTIDRG